MKKNTLYLPEFVPKKCLSRVPRIPLFFSIMLVIIIILVILANLINLGQRVYGPCPYLCDLFTLVLRELCVLPILDNIIPPAHMGFSPLH